MRPDKHGFGPRVAFAWHPLAGSSMVVRGGYGVYYNTSVYQSIADQMAQQSPLSKSFSVANSPRRSAHSGERIQRASGHYARTPSPSIRTFWSVMRRTGRCPVQKDLTDSIVATATYLGVKGTRGVQEFLPNTYPTGAVNPCPTCPRGLHLHDLQWQFDARGRHVATAPPDAQRLRGQRAVHVLRTLSTTRRSAVAAGSAVRSLRTGST